MEIITGATPSTRSTEIDYEFMQLPAAEGGIIPDHVKASKERFKQQQIKQSLQQQQQQQQQPKRESLSMDVNDPLAWFSLAVSAGLYINFPADPMVKTLAACVAVFGAYRIFKPLNQ